LERDIGEVRLLIEDDGCGFEWMKDAAAEALPGFGLKNIAERVRILDGVLRLNSQSGKGTRIEVSIPVREPGDDE
jgi:signal transduction histidine kinase